MSLLVTVKTPAGIVLAADSRLSITAGKEAAHFDRAEKVWALAPPNQHAAVGVYGKAAISLRSAQSLVEEFGRVTRTKQNVPTLAKDLLAFLRSHWDGYGEASFMLAGFDNTSYYGYVYELLLPDMDTPIEHYGQASFGLALGGQREVAQRLLMGHEQHLFARLKDKLELTPKQIQALGPELTRSRLNVPLDTMPLEDSASFARFLVRATARTQAFTLGQKGVGGRVRVALLERGKAARIA